MRKGKYNKSTHKLLPPRLRIAILPGLCTLIFAGSVLSSGILQSQPTDPQPADSQIGGALAERWQQSRTQCRLTGVRRQLVLDVEANQRVHRHRLRLIDADNQFALELLDQERRPVLVWTHRKDQQAWRRDVLRQRFMQQSPVPGLIENHHLQHWRGPVAFGACRLSGEKPLLHLDTADFAGRPSPLTALEDYQTYVALECPQARDPDQPQQVIFYYKANASSCPERALVLNSDGSLRLDINYTYNQDKQVQRVQLFDLSRPGAGWRLDLRLLPAGSQPGPLLPGG